MLLLTLRSKLLLLLLAGVLATCCFTISCTSSSDDDDNGGTSGDYFPNTDGTQWVETVTDYTNGTNQYEATTKISGTKTFAGVNCQVILETDTDEPNTETHRFVTDSGSKITVYGYETYENGSLTETYTYPSPMNYFEYEFSVNQTWTIVDLKGIRVTQWDPEEPDDDLDGDGQADTMDILMTATVTSQEDVTVPAGTFNSYKIQVHFSVTIHGTRIGDYTQSGIVNYVWFAPNVGTVKEESYDFDGNMEELTELKSYSLG